uniref:Uncharacterized protein n=1 Tax=Ditylenchus dipsaci TaxID=166011 RepID=A0A915EP38_9BILA
MAQLFGPDCEFLSLSFSSFQGGAQLIEKLITRIRAQAPEKDRSRPKERSQSILKIKRRRSIPHPLKFLQNHSGDDKAVQKRVPEESKLIKLQLTMEVPAALPENP